MTSAVSSSELASTRRRRRLRGTWNAVRRSPRGFAGLILILGMLVGGLAAPLLTPYDPIVQNLSQALQSPTWAHPFGTDNYGRDILSRVLFGVRASLLPGVLAVGAAVIVGGGLGALAGFYGGWRDNVIMRIMDILLALPTLLLAIAIISALGGGLTNMMIAIGLSQVPIYARTLRSEVMKVREQEFVEVARSLGARDRTVLLRHVLPNCLAPGIVRITMGMAGTILACSALSFIGLGVAPPTPEWGAMLNSGREYLRTHPHMTLFPGLAIMLAVLALNFIGDAARDALDPKSAGLGRAGARRRRVRRTTPGSAHLPGGLA